MNLWFWWFTTVFIRERLLLCRGDGRRSCLPYRFHEWLV